MGKPRKPIRELRPLVQQVPRQRNGELVMGDPPESISAEQAGTPENHLRLHREPGMCEEHRFLVSCDETVHPEEIESRRGSIREAVAGVGEPLTVELTSPATAPFHVVRALVPGIVPISFGFDREPLGLSRLARPRTPLGGRRIGRALDLRSAGPLTPHPFP